ncbi:two-component regulator propeller domain-containing protein [Agarivorans sp. Z349TD_8]|uniref:ligand-binding sensor domain-containing protein n=1 Tax=Agarivorans sp. Z349TD_8 TaxID=3421434 RepID=UPI003D7D980E
MLDIRIAWLICFAILSTFSFTSHATALKLADYYTDVWTSVDGLPHNSINAITQTDDGYLWFATWEGVARYDGLHFTLFGRGETTGMKDSGTRTLVADSNNSLWLAGARGSMALRKGYQWSNQANAASLVNHALVDQHKNLWIAVEGLGVYYRARGKDGNYLPDVHILSGFSAYHLAQSSSGDIFAATDNGLYRVTPKSYHKLELPLLGDRTRVYSLAFDHQDRLLLASNHGPWRYDGQQFTRLNNTLDHVITTAIIEDREGNIWFGTSTQGVGRIANHQLEFKNANSGLPHNRVISLFEDQEGSIWVGTNGGLIRFRNAAFQSFTEQDGLIGNYVRTVLPINSKQVLVGTSQGLSLLEDGQAMAATQDPVSRQGILSLAKNHQGGAYVGTYRNGVYQWQNHQLQQLWNEDSGLPHNEVRALLKDSHNNLWIGTPNGLVKIKPQGEMQYFTKQNSNLPDNYILAIAEDEFGKIWVGTGVGLAFIRDDKVSNVPIHNLEQAQYAFGFYLEPGYVWIASDRGIIRYQQHTQQMGLVGRPAGLPIDKFFQIVNDQQGSLWLSSNRGLWKISYQQAHLVASGQQKQINFELYSEIDGMASSQANGGSNPAAAITEQGQLLFASAKGLISIQPQDLAIFSAHPLPVTIDSIQFDSQSISPDTQSIAPAGTNLVRFIYSGLGYVMPKRLQFRTKLEGFDREWSYRGTQRVAEFTNLPPGSYRFLVSARYPYGEWNDSNFIYQFKIEPLFWQRREIQALLALLLLLVIGGMVYFRIYLLKRNEERLTEQVEIQVKALREQSAQFERLSNEDALTKLPNRRAFDANLSAQFSQCSQQQQPISLVVLDIDHFKSINDNYSHLVGDKVIQALATTLVDYVGDTNKVARWGGEEFTILYLGNQQQARDYFQALLLQIQAMTLDALKGKRNITVSMGICDSDHCDDYSSLLKLADHALYQAKHKGRNRIEIYNNNQPQ